MFADFETPSEPQMGSANAIQDKYNSMILDLNDDLQDEIGTRREQFDSISKTCDDLYTRIVDMTATVDKNIKLAVIGITIGVLSICANIATILFL
jgi:hypothetical protein